MYRVFYLTILLCSFFEIARTQDTTLLISGPMLGYVEHREALIWLQVTEQVTDINIKYFPAGKPALAKTIHYDGILRETFNPEKIILENLDMNAAYDYEIYLNNKKQVFPYPLTFKTKDTWEFRRPAPDFSFIFGSCAYINDPVYDRPGEPYGRDPRIFDTMAKTNADFMLWIGDNTYTREADWTSKSGFYYRYTHTRKNRQLQHLLASVPNYAIWDDHDYGPNDGNASFELKDVSLQAFKDFWGNKTFGETDNPGVYTKFTWSDCDFFLLDDRYYRSGEALHDSATEKKYLGDRQLTWLKNGLLSSRATFKFVTIGNQVLNPLNDFESYRSYREEYDELMQFIKEYRIPGIIFLTGDRHISDLIKVQPEGMYPLFDITSSPLTSRSFARFAETKEFNNPYRVVPAAVTDQNFIKIEVSGARNNRMATVAAITVDNKRVWTYEIKEMELK
jgi:alkaline phosphatase D